MRKRTDSGQPDRSTKAGAAGGYEDPGGGAEAVGHDFIEGERADGEGGSRTAPTKQRTEGIKEHRPEAGATRLAGFCPRPPPGR
jgi:hypothetical protein